MAMHQHQDRLPPSLVTHIVQDIPFIKVYATNDVSRIALLDEIISNSMLPNASPISSPNDIMKGKIVLVPRFHKYRRAEVVDSEGQNMVIVKFKDIGGTARCNIYDLKVITTPELKRQLSNIPAINWNEYILCNAFTSREWTPNQIETVNVLSNFPPDRIKLHILRPISNHALVKVSLRSGEEDFMCFSSWLMDHNLANVVDLETMQATIHSKYPPAHIQYPTVPPGFPPMNVQQQHIMTPTLPYPFPSHPVLPAPISNGFSYGVRPATMASLPTPRLRGPRPAQFAQQTEPPKEQIPQTFVPETLPVGSKHDVFVSFVIDGALNFTVQLKSRVEDMLTPFMMTINETPVEPFTDPLQPGTICLGRYMADKALCRAVVSTVLADGANLYFVDFGNSDIVPFDEIYKIKPEFVREKMVAMRFSLADVTNDYLLTTKDASKVFEQLTGQCDYPIRLEVVKPETPLKQFCKLFLGINGQWVNVRDKMKDKMKVLQPVDYKTLPFKKGTQADVIISYTETPARFFVQLSLNAPQLSAIMKAVEIYCSKADDKEILYAEDLNVNVPICAKFAEDGLWYRAQVVSEPDEAGNVEVLFVDYGNSEIVHFSQLRAMTNEIISLGPVQAVECRLNFSPELSARDDVIDYFSSLMQAEEFAMRVENVLPAKMLLVDLIDKANNVDLKDALLKRFSVAQEVPPPADIRGMKANFKSTAPPQNTGNWRNRQNSSGNDGDFSAFNTHPRTNSHGATDETDNVKTDFSENRDRVWTRDSAQSKRFEKNDGGEQFDTWKKPRQEEPPSNSWINHDTNRYSQHDDRTSRNEPNNSSSWQSRDNEGGFRSRGRDNDRDGGGGRSFNRDGADRPWKSGRGGDDRGGDRKPYERRDDNSSKPNGGADDWDADKKEDNWSSGNRRGGDRDFRSNDRYNDRGRGGDDRGPPYEKRSNDWNAEKKDDNWSNENRRGADRDFKYNDRRSDENRGGYRDSKPWGDKGGGYREKRNFGGGSGSWRNDNDAGSGWDTAKTPSREPAYERGALFVEPNYQPGETAEVVVSWFVNPMQFYVIPAENSDFRAMMETVQPDYSRREVVDLSSLAPNECVVARDKDDVIYRARFLRSRPNGAVVSFVDYGNSSTVTEAWAVCQDHCAIPIQAICCKLHDITKADESTPWSVMQDLDSYFKEDKYTLTFVECIEENGSRMWSINLKNATNEDIGDLLVNSGFAVRKNVLKSEELFDATLLKNQTLPAYPGAIESSKKFFVHIEPEQARVIQRLIAELVESQKTLPLPPESIVEGEFCLAPSDDDYYRALIISVDQKTENAHVLFIDYGDDSDVPFSSVKLLPDHLKIYDSQIVECCLYEGDSPKDEVDLDEILGCDLIIKVVDVIDNKLHVILYDEKGVRHPYPEAVDETISPLCKLPILRFNDSVSIAHIENDKVYIQRNDDGRNITMLENELFEFYDKLEAEKVALEVDKFYAAKSAKFETWYRCAPVNSECKEMFFVDYGNTESVDELLSIKLLDPHFYAAPMFCAGVSTNVHFTAEDLTSFIEVVQNITFKATFKSVGPNEWYADLTCESTSRTLADYAAEAGCGEVTLSSEEKATPYSAFATWKLGEEKEVRVSHVDSPAMIYLQTVEDQPTLTSLQDELQLSLTRVLPLLGAHDDLMAAHNPTDKKWYRVSPKSKDDVYALDFGFVFRSPMLKKLPKRFKLDESTYTVACSLNLQPMDGDWSAEAVARLRDTLTEAEKVTVKLEFIKHRSKFVDIKAGENSISEMFSANGVTTYPKPNDVIVCHVNSLEDFYLQYREDEDEIYALVEKMKEADAWDAITEPEVDQIFAAQFVDDEQWYRAVMVEAENKLVRFVDYGNVGSSTQFKALPKDLLTLPPYAVQCIQHPMPENADQLHDIFVQFASAVEGYFTAFVISGGAPMMVMLEYKERIINDVLTEKKTLLEWKLKPAEVGDKVVVSHLNSPSSFYVRSETATFDEVEKALAAVESVEPLAEFAVDDIVAAKFPDDGLWYRAKLIDTAEEKTTVLFIDYGNQSEVKDVRALPDGAKLVACIAKHCSIPVPDGLAEWPSVASVRFAELTCFGEAVFEMSIKEDGDPAVVDLHEHGSSVVDELATLCKADLTTPTLETSKQVVMLSHVAGVDAFWIQYQSPQLDEMTEEMANVEAFENLETVEVGMLVAAQFEEMWYRAVVVKEATEEEVCKVMFIDYGNEAEATEMKRLPEDLANLAPLAKCCRLKKNVPADAETSTLEKLQQFVDEMKSFSVDELIESADQSVVSLRCCDDGKTLAEIIFGADESENIDHATEVVEQSVDAAEELEQPVDTTEVIEQSVDATKMVEQSVETTEMVERFVDATETVEKSIDTTETVKQSVDTTEMVEELVDATGIVQQSVDTPKLVEQSVDATEVLEQSVDALETVEPSVDAKIEEEASYDNDDVKEVTETEQSTINNGGVEEAEFEAALESTSIASPKSDKTNGDQFEEPITGECIRSLTKRTEIDLENQLPKNFTANTEAFEDVEENPTTFDESENDSFEVTVTESCPKYEDDVVENEDKDLPDDRTASIVDAEERLNSEKISDVEPKNEEPDVSVKIENGESTPLMKIDKIAEDVAAEESPEVTERSSIDEKAPLSNVESNVEFSSTPVKNGHALLEDESDQFQTPSCRSSIGGEFVTPEQLLDQSSTSEGLLDSSYSNDSFLVRTVLDSPEYSGLFENVATDELDKCDCRVSYVTDVRDFYVQRIPDDVKYVELMEKLLAECAADCTLTDLESPQVGDMVAVKLDDGVWYRAKVINATSDSSVYELMCVDHGKPCSSKEVLSLPEKLSVLPAFAHKCALAMTKVPASVSQTFKETVSNCETLKIKFIEEDGDTKMIDLRDGSNSVTQKLMAQFLSE